MRQRAKNVRCKMSIYKNVECKVQDEGKLKNQSAFNSCIFI